MTPEVQFVADENNSKRQVVTFSPPVASWSFLKGHTLDELWLTLLQGSSALAMEHAESEFEGELEAAMRKRINEVLTFWEREGWVSFTPVEPEPTPFLGSPETSTES